MLLACLPLVSQANSSILLLGHSFTDIRIYLFGIPTQAEDQQLSRNCLRLQIQIETAETLGLWTEQHRILGLSLKRKPLLD